MRGGSRRRPATAAARTRPPRCPAARPRPRATSLVVIPAVPLSVVAGRRAAHRPLAPARSRTPTTDPLGPRRWPAAASTRAIALARSCPVACLIGDAAQAEQRRLRRRRKRRRPFIRLPGLCAITERLELCAQEEVGVVLQHRLTRDLSLSQLIDRFLVPSTQPEHAAETNSGLDVVRISLNARLYSCSARRSSASSSCTPKLTSRGTLIDRMTACVRTPANASCAEAAKNSTSGSLGNSSRARVKCDSSMFLTRVMYAQPTTYHRRTSSSPAGLGTVLRPSLVSTGRTRSSRRRPMFQWLTRPCSPSLLSVVHEQRETTRPRAYIGPCAAAGNWSQDGDVGMQHRAALQDVVLGPRPCQSD